MNRFSPVILIINFTGLLLYQIGGLWWPAVRDQVLSPGWAWIAPVALIILGMVWPVQRHDQK